MSAWHECMTGAHALRRQLLQPAARETFTQRLSMVPNAAHPVFLPGSERLDCSARKRKAHARSHAHPQAIRLTSLFNDSQLVVQLAVGKVKGACLKIKIHREIPCMANIRHATRLPILRKVPAPLQVSCWAILGGRIACHGGQRISGCQSAVCWLSFPTSSPHNQ
jgi:hypothetical protein